MNELENKNITRIGKQTQMLFPKIYKCYRKTLRDSPRKKNKHLALDTKNILADMEEIKE